MTQERLGLGRWGEEQAAEYLRRQGWRIVERNLRTPLGELDLVMCNREVLAFVEVKTRRGAVFGLPQEAVTSRKQRQIVRAAQWYLKRCAHPGLQPRFDVVAVRAAAGGACIEHIANAFTL